MVLSTAELEETAQRKVASGSDDTRLNIKVEKKFNDACISSVLLVELEDMILLGRESRYMGNSMRLERNSMRRAFHEMDTELNL